RVLQRITQRAKTLGCTVRFDASHRPTRASCRRASPLTFESDWLQRLCGPGRAPGLPAWRRRRVAPTPQPDLLKDGGDLAAPWARRICTLARMAVSSLRAAGEGPGRFSFNVI